MTLLPDLDSVPLTPDGEGGYHVGTTRVSLDIVVRAYHDGSNPEGIVNAYDTLNLADVYRVIGYYLDHRREVDDHLWEREKAAAKLRQEIEAVQGSQEGLKAKLEARQLLNEREADSACLARLADLLRAFGCPWPQPRPPTGIVREWLEGLTKGISVVKIPVGAEPVPGAEAKAPSYADVTDKLLEGARSLVTEKLQLDSRLSDLSARVDRLAQRLEKAGTGDRYDLLANTLAALLPRVRALEQAAGGFTVSAAPSGKYVRYTDAPAPKEPS